MEFFFCCQAIRLGQTYTAHVREQHEGRHPCVLWVQLSDLIRIANDGSEQSIAFLRHVTHEATKVPIE